MLRTLLISQISVSIALVITILMQSRAEGLGKMFGGGGEVFRTKRGLEKLLYRFTIVLIIALVILSFLILQNIG